MISVPAGARSDYNLAREYLMRDSVERRLFERLNASPRHFYLTINHRNDDHFDPNNDTIAWDPYSALRIAQGGTQSPALGLGHEVAHAVEAPSREDALTSHRLPLYDNAEERRVIRGSESHAAHTLGEAVRFDHRGSTYRVATPVSR